MAAKKGRGIKLGTICPKITRGIQLSKGQIIECLSAVPTGYRYLSLAALDKSLCVELDIDTLPYFDPTPLGKSVEQFCIQKDMVLLSKNDTPYKVDLVGDMGDEKIIASGNIYMMTVDPEKLSPACLCFWLKSNEGMMMLRNSSASTGSNMKWISIKQLKDMLVPEFSQEEQEKMLYDKIEEVKKAMLVIQKQLASVANMLTILKNAATDVNEDK